ncbi:hypothetical protein DXG03_008142 [Asterophora parasitica]|uniref:Uncharacterized protein n=1 Tax=Asterophora parasitica TaxID=117018 RepID=A0A9P7G9C4_9AGAR|nr:hypothetical protein DXG03_008142 [Asterophora parasitica]
MRNSRRSFTSARELGDPNAIPVSPSLSAMNALALFEPAPSVAESEIESVRAVTPPRPAPSVSAPPTEGLPEIPDSHSQSSKPPAPPPKQSKLSLLASSRANSVSSRSESSRSSGIALTGSVKTFPDLRPSTQSVRTSSPAASLPHTSRPPSPPGENAAYYNAPSTGASSMSSHVRRAIQTAMELEAVDATPKANTKPLSSPSPSVSSRGPAIANTEKPRSPSLSSSVSPVRKDVGGRTYKEVDIFGSSKPAPSKLALLAKAKTSGKGPKVPKPVTEYLTPTANGSTATTAITTSYQTLYTLTDPTRSRVIPPQHVVPFGITPPEIEKRSKLAAKIRRAHEKQQHSSPPREEEEAHPEPVSPIFYPKSSAHVCASPSAFASLLVDDPLMPSEDKDKTSASRRREKEHRHRAELENDSPERRRHRSRKYRHEPPVPIPSTSSGFSFDGPSPDDVVLNARRGTSLAQQKTAKEREKALKKAAGLASASSSRPPSALSTPMKKKPSGPGAKKSGSSTPLRGAGLDARQLDLSALNLTRDDGPDTSQEPPPKITFARDKLLEEAKRVIDAEGENKKKGVSLVVVGA